MAFNIKDAPESGHCCFCASIVDDEGSILCKCLDREDAELILSAIREEMRLRTKVERMKKLGHELLDIIENTPNGCVPLPYGFLIEMWRKAFGKRKEE